MLIKKNAAATATGRRLRSSAARTVGQTMDRRAFLKHSGLGVGAGAIAIQLPYNLIGDAAAAPGAVAADNRLAGGEEVKRTVCTHCSVGCAVDAVVKNGV